jgi:predicted hydrocarbon binding protein
VHGLIFASLQEYLEAEHGSEAAGRVFAGEGEFQLDSAYPDARFREVVAQAATAAGLDEDELLRRFGVFAGRTTFRRLYPSFFEHASGARDFLLGVEDRIHELVRATVPRAQPPQLFVSELDDERLLVMYTSSRRLCPLLRGLLEGTARHFGEEPEAVETNCMRRGDLACRFEVRLRPARSA